MPLLYPISLPAPPLNRRNELRLAWSSPSAFLVIVIVVAHRVHLTRFLRLASPANVVLIGMVWVIPGLQASLDAPLSHAVAQTSATTPRYRQDLGP